MRFHTMLTRRIACDESFDCGRGAGETMRLPPVNRQSAEQLAAELLLDANFTLDDGCRHVYPYDPPELHQRSPQEDRRWATAIAGGATNDLMAFLQGIHDGLSRFSNKSAAASALMLKAPGPREVANALEAGVYAPLDQLAELLVLSASDRRAPQLRAEWEAVRSEGGLERVRFLFERTHLIYVDSNNDKIRLVSQYAEEFAPPLLRAAFEQRVARGRASVVVLRAWLAKATMTAIDAGLAPKAALVRGCRIALSNVLAVAFSHLLHPDAGLPETLAHHARHLDVMRHEAANLALGGACLAMLHERCSYDEFYHCVSPAAASITVLPTRDELHALAGTSAASSLPYSTIYVPRGTSWLSACDFSAFKAMASPSVAARIDMQRRIACASPLPSLVCQPLA